MFDPFYQLFGNWQMISLALVMLFLLFRILNREYYEKMMRMIPWNKKWIILGVAVVIILQLREIQGYPIAWIFARFPEYTWFEAVFFYVGHIHIRSIIVYSIMIFWLWRKFNAVFPALFSSFFWIGLIELTFIPQHWLWLNYFMGVNHYLPFILIMMPFLLDYKRYLIPGRAWIWFGAGVFLQYACLILAPYNITILDSRGFGFFVNPNALPHPHPLAFMWETLQHLMKTLFTIAGCYTALKIEDSSISFKKGEAPH